MQIHFFLTRDFLSLLLSSTLLLLTCFFFLALADTVDGPRSFETMDFVSLGLEERPRLSYHIAYLYLVGHRSCLIENHHLVIWIVHADACGHVFSIHQVRHAIGNSTANFHSYSALVSSLHYHRLSCHEIVHRACITLNSGVGSVNSELFAHTNTPFPDIKNCVNSLKEIESYYDLITPALNYNQIDWILLAAYTDVSCTDSFRYNLSIVA